jgi:hypothetical protein
MLRFACFVVLLAVPVNVSAQGAANRITVLGIGIGSTQLPAPLVETCGGNRRTMPTVELLAGLHRGTFRVEGRGAAFHEGVVDSCTSIGVVHENGTHTDAIYPYERRHGDISLSLHAHYLPAHLPVMLGVGAGGLVSAQAPFVLGSFGFRAGRRASAVLEGQSRVTLLRYALVTSEWLNSQAVREFARENGRELHVTYAFRLRFELAL